MSRPVVLLLLLTVVALSACETGVVNPTLPTLGPPLGTAATTTTEPRRPPMSTTTSDLASVKQSIVVLGDWGAGTKSAGSIAVAMEEVFKSQPYDTILTTGDNFYTDNISRLFAPFEWTVESDITWWLTLGNHDIESIQRIARIDELFGVTPPWTKHEWDRVDVIILDSNRIDDEDQLQFLITALAGNRPAIVVFHHPAFSCSIHSSTREIVSSWVPILENDGDVVLVLNGHDHNYQHFSEAGIEYVVSGGGGRELYDLTPCPKDHPKMKAGIVAHHFLRLDLDERVLEVNVVDLNGVEIDQFSIAIP